MSRAWEGKAGSEAGLGFRLSALRPDWVAEEQEEGGGTQEEARGEGGVGYSGRALSRWAGEVAPRTRMASPGSRCVELAWGGAGRVPG